MKMSDIPQLTTAEVDEYLDNTFTFYDSPATDEHGNKIIRHHCHPSNGNGVSNYGRLFMQLFDEDYPTRIDDEGFCTWYGSGGRAAEWSFDSITEDELDMLMGTGPYLRVTQELDLFG
jgi:hypothetical protein